MSDNTTLDDFWEFVLKCLKDVKRTTKKNYEKNSNNRKYNVFNCIEDNTIRKYMGLGRSFDSKLGTEIQKIAMKLARVKYEDINVPNIILINTVDEGENRKFLLNLYVIKDSFQQRVFYNINPDDFIADYEDRIILPSKSIEFTLPKNSLAADLEQLNNYKITNKNKNKNINKNKNLLVDLLYIEEIEDIDNTTTTKITTFELKLGGNLDTKNSSANVNEIMLLKDIFKFFPFNEAYFATLYKNTGGEVPSGAVFTKLDEENLKYKVGEDFWNMVLPDELDYNSFIEQYKQKFIESEIEAEYLTLDSTSNQEDSNVDSTKNDGEV